jgi:uncharacterized protein (DUF2141 family)
MIQTIVIAAISMIVLNQSIISGKDIDIPIGEIEVRISGIRNHNGLIRLLLFNASEGFPSEHQKSHTMRTVAIEQDSVTITLYKIPYNTYAVSVLHDENSNGKLDTNWISIPQEGIGVSNNIISTFGSPKYSDCVFKFNYQKMVQNIKMKYY